MIYTLDDLTLNFGDLHAMYYDEQTRGVMFVFKSQTCRWFPLDRSRYREIAKAWRQAQQSGEKAVE